MSHGRQPKVECSLFWHVFAPHNRREKLLLDVYGLTLQTWWRQNASKRKKFDFRLPSVAHERVLSSLILHVITAAQAARKCTGEKKNWYLIFGLGFPLAAHVSVTLSPISAVIFLGGVTITGADNSGWVGSGSTMSIDVRKAKSKLQRVNKEFSKYLIKWLLYFASTTCTTERTGSQGFEAWVHWSARPTILLTGGDIFEWLEARIRNLETTGSRSRLWTLVDLFRGSPLFKSSARLCK